MMKRIDIDMVLAERMLEPMFGEVRRLLMDAYLKGYERGYEIGSGEKSAVALHADDRIEESELSCRVKAACRWNEIKTFGQLLEVGEDMLKWRNFGEKSLREVREYVEKRGCRLKK